MPDKNFKCKRCGYCCTLIVLLNRFDIIRLRFAGYKKKDYSVKDVSTGSDIIKIIDGDCYFLKRDKDGQTECKAYRYRPGVCRKYPHFKKGRCENMNPSVREYREINL